MLEFDVQRCSRKCAKTDRELQAGEAYFSVLINDGDQMKRLDFAAESWDRPPDGAIAWWKSQMPGLGANRMQWAPSDVLLDFFQSLEGNVEQADIRFVLALLLVRRRIARWEHSESDNQNQEIMVLYCPRHELEFRVSVRMPAPERLTEIQNQLSRLLLTPTAA